MFNAIVKLGIEAYLYNRDQVASAMPFDIGKSSNLLSPGGIIVDLTPCISPENLCHRYWDIPRISTRAKVSQKMSEVHDNVFLYGLGANMSELMQNAPPQNVNPRVFALWWGLRGAQVWLKTKTSLELIKNIGL